MHVAFTWSREKRVGKLYVDGFEEGEQSVQGSVINLDANPTGHSVFDIGLKRDSMDQSAFHGYLRDLMVFDRAISAEDVENIYEESNVWN